MGRLYIWGQACWQATVAAVVRHAATIVADNARDKREVKSFRVDKEVE
jgi:hypothetical protein